jgi:hypothetical protein
MDRASKATLTLRVGTLLVAVALAFGIASYTSSLTVSGYHGDVFIQNYSVVPADTYLVLMGWNQASPQQMYFLNISSLLGVGEVLLLKTNQTAFNGWIADRSGLSILNVSSYGPKQLGWFSNYLASHRQELVSQYNIAQKFTVVKYLVPDIEPLMVVLVNGNRSSLNFTYTALNVGIYISPNVGFWVTGLLVGPGVILVAAGLALRRKQITSRLQQKG